MSLDTAAAPKTAAPSPAQRLRMGKLVRFIGFLAAALAGYFAGMTVYAVMDHTQGAALLGGISGLLVAAIVAGIGSALGANVAGPENEHHFTR